MTEIFLTSDHHFYHKNIIGYCDRPFFTVEQMNEHLIEQWNKVVSANDIVIHLGDFAFRGKAREIRKRLNGIIILIRGNHDKCVTEEDGFIIIEGVLELDNLILSHHPLFSFENPKGLLNVHGHIHNKKSFLGENVSVEVTDYKPVAMKKFIKSS